MSHELIIHSPRLCETAAGTRVDIKLESPAGAFDLFFEVQCASVRHTATPFVALCVPLAMTRGWNIRCESPISAQLMDSSQTAQDIIQFFRPQTHRIQLHTPVHEEASLRGRTAASYFSGGVDSFYTYLKHRERITRLIFGWGFDIKLEQESLASLVTQQIQQMAEELGTGLIRLKTNVREFTDPIIHWRDLHGALLGGIATLLSNDLDTVYIASSQHYGDLFPWGSHPMLDHHWSTEAVRVINDGCECKRHEKLALVVTNEVAMRHLRVCYVNRNDRYNCNRCEKCYRTKVALFALGALDRCQTFQPEIDLKHMSELRYGNNGNVMRANLENYELLKQRRPDPEVMRALKLAMRRPSWFKSAKKYVRQHLLADQSQNVQRKAG